MTMRSGLAWLSSSSAEIARARSVLDALGKPGVIDELGFLMLNGALAERLYPGVATDITQARAPAVREWISPNIYRIPNSHLLKLAQHYADKSYRVPKTGSTHAGTSDRR
jgi:hypothetical protein